MSALSLILLTIILLTIAVFGSMMIVSWFLNRFLTGKKESVLRFKIKLGPDAVKDMKILCKTETDIVGVPDSIIGKFVRVRKRGQGKDSVIGEGLVLATHLTQVNESIAVCLKLFTEKTEIQTVNVPIKLNEEETIYIEHANLGDNIKHSKNSDILKDLSNFCNNQCIFDCKDCSIAKYGIRETREQAS